MPWTKLRYAPGISKDKTRYAEEGTWYDGSLVRFRQGLPEKWTGWENFGFTYQGICRSLNRWSTLIGLVYTGIGTSRRFYVSQDGVTSDVTPIDRTVTLANPFSTQNGSNVVTVTDVGHGNLPGNFVIISGAADVGGIPAAALNGERVINTYIDDDTYTILASDGGVPANATSTTTGGGAAVTFSYLFVPGTDSQIYGGGWGSGGYGESEYGGSGESSRDVLGAWSQDNWGEDLVACAFDGPIFYWTASTPTARMVDILDLPLADGNAPAYARFIAVSHKDRHLLAFGVSHEFGGNVYSPMTVRWCSQEDIYNWNEADTTGTAGSIPLSHGSRFICIEPTQREILVWSDTAMFSMQFVGAPDVYVADILATNTDIAGMNAAVTFGTTTFWFGRSGFYAYDGRVQKMNCPVWDYVNQRMNWSQPNKIFASTYRTNDEIIWYYPSQEDPNLENDSYVSYDIVQDIWAVGKLPRTAWLDMDFQTQPLGASPDHNLYYHDIGADDGSQVPAIPINAYLESAPMELSSEGSYDKGDRFVFIRRILPDVTFRDYNDGVNTPSMNMIIKTMDKPGGGFDTKSSSSQVVRTAIIPVEEFTDEVYVRLRGRAMVLRLESNTLGTLWRLGTPRADMRPDGQR